MYFNFFCLCSVLFLVQSAVRGFFFANFSNCQQYWKCPLYWKKLTLVVLLRICMIICRYHSVLLLCKKHLVVLYANLPSTLCYVIAMGVKLFLGNENRRKWEEFSIHITTLPSCNVQML